jgi:hypothetical protein
MTRRYESLRACQVGRTCYEGIRDSHPISERCQGAHDKMAGLVGTTMTPDSLRLTAHRPDKDTIRFVECAAEGLRLRAARDTFRISAQRPDLNEGEVAAIEGRAKSEARGRTAEATARLRHELPVLSLQSAKAERLLHSAEPALSLSNGLRVRNAPWKRAD